MGRSCLLTTLVKGWRRVPEPPASTIPFTVPSFLPSLLARSVAPAAKRPQTPPASFEERPHMCAGGLSAPALGGRRATRGERRRLDVARTRDPIGRDRPARVGPCRCERRRGLAAMCADTGSGSSARDRRRPADPSGPRPPRPERLAQLALAEPDRVGRHLDQLVLVDPLEPVLQPHRPVRDEAHRLVVARRAPCAP